MYLPDWQCSVMIIMKKIDTSCIVSLLSELGMSIGIRKECGVTLVACSFCRFEIFHQKLSHVEGPAYPSLVRWFVVLASKRTQKLNFILFIFTDDQRVSPYRQLLLVALVLTFGVEVGYKLSTSSVIWLANPCHILTMCQMTNDFIFCCSVNREGLIVIPYRTLLEQLYWPPFCYNKKGQYPTRRKFSYEFKFH